jgi:hypothetical protein
MDGLDEAMMSRYDGNGSRLCTLACERGENSSKCVRFWMNA